MGLDPPTTPDLSAAGRARVLRYAVVVGDHAWRVVSCRAQIGRFASRAEAMAVAVNLTRQALEAGNDAELLAHGDPADFRLHSIFHAGPHEPAATGPSTGAPAAIAPPS